MAHPRAQLRGQAQAREAARGEGLVSPNPVRPRLSARALDHPPRPQVRQHLYQRQCGRGEDRRPGTLHLTRQAVARRERHRCAALREALASHRERRSHRGPRCAVGRGAMRGEQRTARRSGEYAAAFRPSARTSRVASAASAVAFDDGWPRGMYASMRTSCPARVVPTEPHERSACGWREPSRHRCYRGGAARGARLRARPECGDMPGVSARACPVAALHRHP